MGKLQEVAKNVKRGAKRRAPLLWLVGGIVGFVGTVVVASVTSVKAHDILKEEEKKNPEITTGKKIAKVAPMYIPTAVLGGLSIAGLVKSHSLSAERIATIASAYSLTDQHLKAYQEKVKEKLGASKEKEIRDDINKDRLGKHPVNNTEVIITGDGEVLCLESFTGRYFKSTMTKLEKAANRLNFRLVREMYVSLNEYNEEIGLPYVPGGDDLGWNVENGLIEPTYSALINDDGNPVIVVDFLLQPRTDYTNLH